MGYSELAMDKVREDDPLRKDLKEICSAAKRSRDITWQLQAFARKETIAHRGVFDEGIQFIQKPFSTQSLAAKVRQTLEEKT